MSRTGFLRASPLFGLEDGEEVPGLARGVHKSRESLGHGRNCDCKDCTHRFVGTGGARDELWLRQHQSQAQVAYDFRVLSARLAMLKDGIYVPKEFDPTLFTHSSGQCAPQELFPEIQCTFRVFPGFTPFRFNLRQERPAGPRTPIAMQLIYTNGACSNNGRAGPKAGVGFASCFPGRENTKGVVSFPLERQGPDGRPKQPTSGRAELRAVIGALEWRNWYREGWEALVIATDSAYVAHGATTWISTWVEMEWRKADGSEVANKDLWKRLLFLFRQYAIHGCEIMIWRIPRELNTLADEAAVRALDGDTLIQWVTHRDPMLKVDTVFDF